MIPRRRATVQSTTFCRRLFRQKSRLFATLLLGLLVGGGLPAKALAWHTDPSPPLKPAFPKTKTPVLMVLPVVSPILSHPSLSDTQNILEKPFSALSLKLSRELAEELQKQHPDMSVYLPFQSLEELEAPATLGLYRELVNSYQDDGHPDTSLLRAMFQQRLSPGLKKQLCLGHVAFIETHVDADKKDLAHAAFFAKSGYKPTVQYYLTGRIETYDLTGAAEHRVFENQWVQPFQSEVPSYLAIAEPESKTTAPIGIARMARSIIQGILKNAPAFFGSPKAKATAPPASVF